MRKSCAEAIHPHDQICSKEYRWNILLACLIQLLQTQSYWVKTAALHVLGYFISIFQRSNDQQEEQEKDKEDAKNFKIPEVFNKYYSQRLFDEFDVDKAIKKLNKGKITLKSFNEIFAESEVSSQVFNEITSLNGVIFVSTISLDTILKVHIDTTVRYTKTIWILLRSVLK